MIGKEIPCAVCKQPTPMLNTKRCHNCWEVEGRLKEYLRSVNGRKFVKEALLQTMYKAALKKTKKTAPKAKK